MTRSPNFSPPTPGVRRFVENKGQTSIRQACHRPVDPHFCAKTDSHLLKFLGLTPVAPEQQVNRFIMTPFIRLVKRLLRLWARLFFETYKRSLWVIPDSGSILACPRWSAAKPGVNYRFELERRRRAIRHLTNGDITSPTPTFGREHLNNPKAKFP
jgi:hypothetical protein